MYFITTLYVNEKGRILNVRLEEKYDRIYCTEFKEGDSLEIENEVKRITEFLSVIIKTYNFAGALIGISGGIDSAVVLALLERAIGSTRIKAINLPERDSSKESIKDALLVCEHFGINCEVQSITGALRKLGVYSLFPPALFIPESIKVAYSRNRWNRYREPYLNDLKNEGDELFLKGVAYYRAKHRIRMTKMYLEAEKCGYCVVGTTNKTEEMMGLYVKWGDDSVDIEPIKHLYKTQVYELAKYLGIPQRIIEKPPMPDLIPGLTDEEAFGLTYPEIDKILIDFENGIERNDESAQKVRKIIELTKWRRLKSVGIDDFSEL